MSRTSASVGFDQYEDWLASIQQMGGEFAWIRANSLAAASHAGGGRSSEQLRNAVLCSAKVRGTVHQLSARRGVSESLIRSQADQILSTMAHDVHFLSTVQPVGYALAKIFGRIFSHIWVNSAQMERIRELASDRLIPIVWLPTHRSYLDFLLLSMLCFHFRIHLPAICAADDFRASFLLGETLRRCGAFFIRRSFKEDPLYWAIFAEYVQQHVRHGDRPIEFFIEGQRSRTFKSVHPRIGLLQIVLEPFLRAQLYDTILVPITIDYDRILEEMLYAQELIGFSKPKETTSGLLRARRVLSDSYGDIRFTVGEPISARKYFLGNDGGALDARLELLGPDLINAELGEKVRGRMRELAVDIVHRQNAQSTLTIWPFIALSILQFLNEFPANSSSLPLIPLHMLQPKVELLLAVFKKCIGNRQIWRRREENLEMEIKHFVRLHHSHLSLASGDSSVQLVPIPAANNDQLHSAFLLNAILIANQANPLIHALAPFCLAAIAQLANERGEEKEERRHNKEKEEVIVNYRFLRNLFGHEFVPYPLGNSVDLPLPIINLDSSDLGLLAKIVKPFLLAYHSIFGLLINSSASGLLASELMRNVHSCLLKLVCHRLGLPLQIASTDLVKNALNVLINEGNALKLDVEKRVQVDYEELSKMQKKLEHFLTIIWDECLPKVHLKANL